NIDLGYGSRTLTSSTRRMLDVRLEVDVALNARLDALFERKQLKKAQAKVGRMRDPVRGTARVVSSSDYRDSTTVAPSWTGCSMTCVVQADGVPAQTSHQRA